MSDFEETAVEGVIDRKMVLCPSLQGMDVDDLIVTCEGCEQFFLYCCSCSMKEPQPEKPCHHQRLVFTDGACSQNGRNEATSGTGIAYGNIKGSQQSIPIDDDIDEEQKRTSQRAELLAAIAGVRLMIKADRLNSPLAERKDRPMSYGHRPQKTWVVATDSQYVVQGMTEWMLKWQKNNYLTSRNVEPTNLDLFLDLDSVIFHEEAKQDVKIGFWHVPREYNKIADRLAKRAARLGEPACLPMEADFC